MRFETIFYTSAGTQVAGRENLVKLEKIQRIKAVLDSKLKTSNLISTDHAARLIVQDAESGGEQFRDIQLTIDREFAYLERFLDGRVMSADSSGMEGK